MDFLTFSINLSILQVEQKIVNLKTGVGIDLRNKK